jgi:hypothetical protein
MPSSGEIIICGDWGLFIEVYGYGEYGVIDYGFSGFCVCHVVGDDDWVWRGC